jgi:glycine hydroxymethyltransferase
MSTLSRLLTDDLKSQDPEMTAIINQEGNRQRDSIALIASENFTSPAVLEALGSIMQNKYSEGYPAARYYGGNEFIDQSEILCQNRALALYGLDPEEWGVNVQSLSGSPANFSVYTAVMEPHDRIMSLDLPHGGHLSHGYQTPTKKISAVSKYFEVLPYRLDEKTGRIDYDTLEANAKLYRPKVLVGGASAYARHIDYARLRDIANQNGSYFLMDMAHISGLIAGGVMPSPFPYADIVTTTTHKSLRGPRGAMIFYRKGVRSVDKKGVETMYDLEAKINHAVFPGHQGGPHNHTIAALAVALGQANTAEFKSYQAQVLANCQALAGAFDKLGYDMVSGGTDNHLILVDLRAKGVNGAKVETLLEQVNISLNKNTVPGDLSAMNPGGVRVGAPAMTSRGLVETDFEKVADFIDRGVQLCSALQAELGTKNTPKFKRALADGAKAGEIAVLKEEVTAFARSFPGIAF